MGATRPGRASALARTRLACWPRPTSIISFCAMSACSSADTGAAAQGEGERVGRSGWCVVGRSGAPGWWAASSRGSEEAQEEVPGDPSAGCQPHEHCQEVSPRIISPTGGRRMPQAVSNTSCRARRKARPTFSPRDPSRRQHPRRRWPGSAAACSCRHRESGGVAIGASSSRVDRRRPPAPPRHTALGRSGRRCATHHRRPWTRSRPSSFERPSSDSTPEA